MRKTSCTAGGTEAKGIEEARFLLLLELYRLGHITLPRFAELAGIPREKLSRMLRKRRSWQK